MRTTTHLHILLAILAALLAPTALSAQSDVLHIQIAAIETDQFPTLQLAVNATDVQGSSLAATPDFSVQINGNPVTPVEVTSTRRPVAVALVSDLSTRMSDQGTGYSRRFDDMLPRIKELSDQLRSSGSFASLVTFDTQVRVAHPLTYDLGAVSNTLNRGNSELIFEAATGPGGAYPLIEALSTGLDQLESADPTSPLALVLFAAGEPDRPEITALRQRIATWRAEGRPLRLLVIGFGSDRPGEFAEYPAGPASLRLLADELGGSFIEVGVQPLNEQTRREVDAQFAAIRRLADQYTLSFSASEVASGVATITVNANGASDSVEFNPGAIPPRFSVVVDSRSFQDQVRLSINTTFRQATIERVEYFLSDLPLATVTQGPEFVYRFDAYDAGFQQQFPPGEYELSAAAFDANDNQSRSSITIPVTVFAAPPPPPLLEQLASYWWVGLIIAALGGIAIYGFVRPRTSMAGTRPTKTATPVNIPPSEEPTVEHGALGSETKEFQAAAPDATVLYRPPSGATTEFQPSRGVPTTRLEPRWFVEVVECDIDRGQRFELKSEARNVNIGRDNPPDHPPEILMHNSLISKGSHARLSLLQHGVELVAGESRNGTFVGDDKREIKPHSSCILKNNDVFWLSRGVKLRVIQEDAL
jgi:hypothetical protein